MGRQRFHHKRIKKTKYYDSLPKTNKVPKKGDLWLAKFPYEVSGNMEKLRPVLISQVLEDTIICRKITTNHKRGKKIEGYLEKYFKRPSYITKSYSKLSKDKFYKRLFASKENQNGAK